MICPATLDLLKLFARENILTWQVEIKMLVGFNFYVLYVYVHIDKFIHFELTIIQTIPMSSLVNRYFYFDNS